MKSKNVCEKYYVRYRDVEGEECFSRKEHSSIEEFKEWCRSGGVKQLKNFSNFKLVKKK